ncbi:hypothetical protein COMA1_10777 [Candidatus Nitrospira nitrosa]|uniref:Uncharacterized protein n=1 Tax=Candidatus Nitrospira nitrosa TaxID=1742972 RepID=A0A0S4L7Y4_9BACT|nr:hypothetical protein [Candidatus Nitrospira nitrosa]CUS32717.1 hypothetical protein COMA1_10777 [Candidatus Nitrospira nitrosa]
MMTKDDLVGIFRTAKNNCKLVYASLVLFAHEDMPTVYEKWSSALNLQKPFDEEEVVILLRDQNVSRIAWSELYDTVHRAAVKELFEVTKNYCDSSGQNHLLAAQPWYQFWRVVRNCLSHDFRLRFTDYDRNRLPVSWRGVTIDQTMEGKPLTHGVLSRQQLLEFLDEVALFIEKQLA